MTDDLLMVLRRTALALSLYSPLILASVLGIVERFSEIHSQSIESVLEYMCKILPPTVQPACLSTIETYGPVIVALLGALLLGLSHAQQTRFRPCAGSMFALIRESPVLSHRHHDIGIAANSLRRREQGDAGRRVPHTAAVRRHSGAVPAVPTAHRRDQVRAPRSGSGYGIGCYTLSY